MRLRTALVVLLLLFGTELAYAERAIIFIDKTAQRMTVSVDGQKRYVWPVSTAVAGYTTPSGTYRPFRMEEFHFSEEWDDAPMPHSIFFTRLGHAIHGTEYVNRLGRRASHGCVRLDPNNAATLYTLVEEVGMPNTTVVVTGRADRTDMMAVGRAEKKANPTAVATGTAENTENKKGQPWPFERKN